jgi:hypothetical protein
MLSEKAVTVMVSVGRVTVAPIATVCACAADAAGVLDDDSGDALVPAPDGLPADEHPASRSEAVRAVAPNAIDAVRTLTTRPMTSPDFVDPLSIAIGGSPR